MPVGEVRILVQYWLAGQAGRGWLKLHKSLRPAMGDLPWWSLRVAHRETVSAETMWRVQEFGVRVWWRLGLLAILLLFPLGGIVALLQPSQGVLNAIADLLFGLICVMAVALAQAGILRYRANSTRQYLRKRGAAAAGQPLPADATGSPQQFDFWVSLVIALTLFAVLLTAATWSGTSVRP